jgi:predicted  nucleic acid-binding Zn-ribbon protein
MPRTRKEELDHLDQQIADLRAKLKDETSAPRRAKLQRQIEAQADKREAAFKAQARRRFPGTEEEFTAAYPAIKAEWQRDLALGRTPADDLAGFVGSMPRL